MRMGAKPSLLITEDGGTCVFGYVVCIFLLFVHGYYSAALYAHSCFFPGSLMFLSCLVPCSSQFVVDLCPCQ